MLENTLDSIPSIINICLQLTRCPWYPSRCMQIMPVLVCLIKFYNQSNLRSKEFLGLTQPSLRKGTAGVPGGRPEEMLLLPLSLCWFCSPSFVIQPALICLGMVLPQWAGPSCARGPPWPANTVSHIHSKRPL